MVDGSSVMADGILFSSAFALLVFSFDFFRQNGATLAESGAYGCLAVIMVLSWIAQVTALAGWIDGYLLLVSFIGVLSLVQLTIRRKRLGDYLRQAYRSFGSHRLASAGLLVAWAYILVSGTMGMGSSPSMENSFWGLLQDPNHSLLRDCTRSVPVLNHIIFFSPWYPDIGLPLTRSLAYAVIGLGTFALARRYAWPPMAATVSLLVTGMPRLVSQAVTGGVELLVAAAALVAILALYRLLEKPSVVDLTMLVSAIAFTVDGGKLCYLMASVIAGLSGFLFVRRHGMGWFRHIGRLPVAYGMVLLCSLAVFLQLGVVSANLFWGHAWIGATTAQDIIFNGEPLLGTAGNLMRYLVLSIDLPQWINTLSHSLFGVTLSSLLDLFYQRAVAVFIGTAGAAAVFVRPAVGNGVEYWFGPAGFLLVLPSMVYSLWRGPRRLKATALAMLAYWMLICLIIAWQPHNVRWLTAFFVCCGFFMAFFLPPWRIGHHGRMVLQILGIAQIGHVLLL